MSLFKRSAGIRAIRFGVEPTVVAGEAVVVSEETLPAPAEVNILAAYVGEHLVWNGRVSQNIQIPAAASIAVAPVMSMSLSAMVDSPLAVGFAEAFSPAAVRAGVRMDVPPAVAVATAEASDSSRDQIVAMPTVVAVADSPTAEIAVSAGSTVFMEVAGAAGVAPDSESASDSLFEMPVAAAYAETPVSSVLTGYLGEAPVATASAMAYPGDVTSGHSISVPVSAAQAAALVPVTRAGSAVDIPVSTGSAAAPDGSVATPSYVPMGMDKLATQTLSANAWFQITGWTVRADYPNTVIGSNGLVVEGSHDMTVNYRVQFSGAGLASQTKGARVKVNGAVIHTVSAGGDGTANSFRAGSFAASLQDNDVITLEAWHGSSVGTNRVVQEGATNTFLYFDAA